MEITEVISGWDKKITAEGENKHSISELCRLCGNENNNFLPLFGSNIDNGLRKKIEMHLPIHPRENDGLPQRVCYFCASTVLSFSDIYESILKVEENFLKILKNELPSKQGACVSRNKGTECGLHSIENRKPLASIKPGVRVVSVKGEIERSRPQDRETVSQNKLESRIDNASFSVYENSDASALLNDLENGIIDGQSVGKSDAAITLVPTVHSRNHQGTDHAGHTPAQATQMINPGTHFNASHYLKTDDTCVTTVLSREVQNEIAESSCDTADSQIEFRDILPDSNDSNTVNETESSAVFSEYSDPQSMLRKTCRYKYRLRMIRNGFQKMMYIVVQWEKMKNDGAFKCKYCKCSFYVSTVLATHTRFHTQIAPFYCKYCGESFMLSGSLKYHIKQCTKSKKRLEIATRASYSSHHSIDLHASDYSDLNYFNNPPNTSHSNNSCHSTERTDGEYSCELCGKSYKLKSTLKEHLMHHLGRGSRKLKCEKCFAKFLTKAELMEHLKNHGDYLVCELCDKMVLNEKDLQAHLISHSALRPYSCSICGVSYKRKSHMTRHLLTHKNNRNLKKRVNRNEVHGKDLKCDECGKESRTWRSHRTHIMTHKKEKHECDECGKLFAQPNGVIRHKHTVHNKARDFACKECNKKFSAKATLVNHLRIHTGERPHQCSTCGKLFRIRQQQKLHERIHSDIFPFQCEYCPKKFRRKLNLVVHTRTHTGEKPYLCQICGRGFAQRSDRKKHQNSHR
ncbi:hypothetical protein R5R35_009165 [Gryllus longicercus]|uniref:Zinc finger protein n=1 Tax=Gryllus longicercus TaxID=2509291 RepID=A0AAN9V7X5_9ORTH